MEQDAAAGAPGPSADEPEAGRRRRGAEERRAQAEARNRAYRALKGPQEQVKRLEAEMTRLQARRDALTGQMADPDIIADADRYQEVLAEYAALEPELERTERAWLEAAEELDRLENDVT